MIDTKLLSVIGNDEYGRAVVNSLGTAASNIRTLPDIGTARLVLLQVSKNSFTRRKRL